MAINQVFEFPVRELSSNRLKLTPFDIAKHAGPFTTGLFLTEEDLVSRLRRRGKIGTTVFFAVIDKTRPASEANPDGRAAALSVEGSYIIVLPPFQRTHVATHAVGLFLHYALDTPDEGGLGLRRVQWQADPSSTASLNAAQRVGFRKEGTLRWASFVVDGDERGKMYNRRGCPPYGDPKARGRGSVYFSMCWDDSLERKRELVDERMAK